MALGKEITGRPLGHEQGVNFQVEVLASKPPDVGILEDLGRVFVVHPAASEGIGKARTGKEPRPSLASQGRERSLDIGSLLERFSRGTEPSALRSSNLAQAGDPPWVC
jgi:hypothetical protein